MNLEKLAHQTVYFSGAKLESLLNEAAINAARRSSGSIQAKDIDKAFYTVIAGAEKRTEVLFLNKTGKSLHIMKPVMPW